MLGHRASKRALCLKPNLPDSLFMITNLSSSATSLSPLSAMHGCPTTLILHDSELPPPIFQPLCELLGMPLSQSRTLNDGMLRLPGVWEGDDPMLYGRPKRLSRSITPFSNTRMRISQEELRHLVLRRNVIKNSAILQVYNFSPSCIFLCCNACVAKM